MKIIKVGTAVKKLGDWIISGWQFDAEGGDAMLISDGDPFGKPVEQLAWMAWRHNFMNQLKAWIHANFDL